MTTWEEKNKTRIINEILGTYGHSPACLEAKERSDEVHKIICHCDFEYIFKVFKDGYEAGKKAELQTLVSKLEGEKIKLPEMVKSDSETLEVTTYDRGINAGLDRAKEIALEMGKGER